MWRQVNDANWRIPYVGGWCEGYVEGAWGQATLPQKDVNGNWYTTGVYNTAIDAWNAEPVVSSHAELPPAGITVPIYFSLGNVPAGHVAIMLDDGKVASSTQAGNPSQANHQQGYIHPNLQDLINLYGKYNGGCKYLGWGEHVGHIRVVEQVSNNATDDQIRQAYLDILERPADDGGLAHYRSYTNDFVRNDLMNSDERRQLLANKATAAEAAIVAAKAEADRVEALRVAAEAKARQDAIDAENARLAKEASDKAIADAKAATDAELAKQAKDNTQFIIWLKNIFEIIGKFLTSWKK